MSTGQRHSLPWASFVVAILSLIGGFIRPEVRNFFGLKRNDDHALSTTMNVLSWSSLWTAVAIVVIYFALRPRLRRGRKRRKFRIFLSMQMSQLGRDEYKRVRDDIMKIVLELRKTDEVYFFNEDIFNFDDFLETDVNPNDYLRRIRDCDYFIAIIVERICSSIYFEAGYALAYGRESLYFVPQENVTPVLMRVAAAEQRNPKLIQVGTLHEIPVRIINILNNARGGIDA
jgi:hypothetical protein